MKTRLPVAAALGLFCGAVSGQVLRCAQTDNVIGCSINVMVDELNLFGTKKCVVRPRFFGHYWIGFKQGEGSVVIAWKIDAEAEPGYDFTTTGIAFDGNSGVFTNPTPTAGAFSWTNSREGAATDCKYTILVTNGSVSCSLDPWVRNQ